MDTSHTLRPRDSVSRTVVGRSNVVRTDLSPSQSVNASQQASVPQHAPNTLTRDPALDPQCHAVLEREREERERRRRARKDEILLRQKAYGQTTLQPASQPPEPQDGETQHADFQV